MTDPPVIRVPELEALLPGLAAGITVRPADFGLTTAGSAWSVVERYRELAAGLGFSSTIVCRQVHGSSVLEVGAESPGGLCIAGDADGLVGAPRGTLSVVTVADCVPVFMVDPGSGRLGLLHAGWRGTAAGILSSGIDLLLGGSSHGPGGLRIHLGPAICGSCYQVGAEVAQALRCERSEGGTVDLRGVLVSQALERGVQPDFVSSSPECTVCQSDRLHSHRATGGSAGRMAAFLGLLR